MQLCSRLAVSVLVVVILVGISRASHATPRKVHVVALGAVRRVPYSRSGDPAGAAPDEISLKIRPLVVDGNIKEWTTGEVHDITDRSFVVRRVLRINDELPGEKPAEKHYVWQRGPWLLIDRVSGHVTALKLPDYDPGVSHVVWFRDYAAYCGLTSTGKSLYAVVAQLAARKPVLANKLGPFDTSKPDGPACGPVEWQRDPLRATFHPSGKDAVSYQFIPGSALLVENSEDDSETTAPPQGK